MVSVVGGTGKRSRPATSGLGATAGSATAGHPLDVVATELIAKCCEHPMGVVPFAARVEPCIERRGDDGRRDVLVDAVEDGPAALTGVRHMAAEVREVVALRLEGALGELAEPRA